MLVEQAADGAPDEPAEGRADHQGPDVDGSTRLLPDDGRPVRVGELLRARVVASEGVDLVARREAAPGVGR